jgi:hypothetical protein
MEQEQVFFKRCPIAGCKTISGFSIPQIEIDKDKKYFCQECGKETQISRWIDSNEEAMSGQISIRKGKDRFIDSVCTYFRFSKGTKNNAMKIIKEIGEEWQLNKKQVTGIMAGAIYLSSLINDEKQTQSRVARVCGISVPTLRKSFQKIVEIKDIKKKFEERRQEYETLS